jgi:WD40 repeat protein
MRSVAGGRGELREAVPTPDGRALVTVDAGGAVVRWDLPVATPHELATYPGAARLVLDATGQRLAVADASYALHVLTLAGAPAAPPLFGHVAEINQLAFAPDGRTLASHHEYVYAVAFTPDSRRIVTATRLGTISMIADDLPRDEAALRAYLATATNLEVVPPDATPH